MDVRLLNSTPDPQRAIATAARLCYAPIGAAQLMETMTDEEIEKILRIIMSSGHHSALEHASFTFAIDGVSRALTHQLVRHRIASYNQQSQRYVSFDDDPTFIVPPEVDIEPLRRKMFLEACGEAFASYRAMIEEGVAVEDARYLLPNATETKIVVTMNTRELLHFFSLRCCQRAQWEIRELSNLMLELATPVAPYIFMDAGAPCRRGPCPEGKMSCGNPFERILRV
ncbi:MAG: FAD-dependent thymidylate synthase [Actinomycetia bacterium]|nr:FAD-dependent thymidylate synthase [Actinomycetes bacterium]